jgi:hypothetical protein
MVRIAESLALGGSTLPILFVRYNPHAFAVDGRPCRVPRAAREEIRAASDAALRVLYMYYDSERPPDARSVRPCVLSDAEYNPQMAECVLPGVVSPQDSCGAAFADSHAGEKPHTCGVEGCGAAFAQSGHLTVHKRKMHTNERPFICDVEVCGAAFADSSGAQAGAHR